MKPRELANELEHMLNNMGSIKDEDEFVDGVMTMHRTLQQKMAHLIIKVFVRWAQCIETDNYDLRNEATVHMAMSIIEHLAEKGMLYKGRACLPFI